MAQKIINARAKNKRDTSANWTANDPVLLDGEIIIVDTAEGEVRIKIGDGTKKYSQLPFEDEKLRNLLNDKLGKTATAANSSKLNGQEASYYATDSNTVHKAGNETIAGVKTFSGKINVNAGAAIKTSGNAILNVETIATTTDYAHLYTSGTSNNKRPLVLNASPDGSGPVGIGVVQPTEKLEVDGNIKATEFKGKIDWSNIQNAPAIPDLNNVVVYDETDTIEAITPLDADTLGGNAPSYYATKASIDAANSGISSLQASVTNAESSITSLQESVVSAQSDIGTLQTSAENLSSSKVDKAGGTMNGKLIAQNNADYAVKQMRNIFISTAAPTASDGANGDIWLKYEA